MSDGLAQSERGYMLAPCLCGGRAEVHSYGGFNVVCLGTDAETDKGCDREGPECATPEDAVAAWNAARKPAHD